MRGEKESGAPHHEGDRIAAEDDEEHRDEHDQREVVGEPVARGPL